MRQFWMQKENSKLFDKFTQKYFQFIEYFLNMDVEDHLHLCSKVIAQYNNTCHV